MLKEILNNRKSLTLILLMLLADDCLAVTDNHYSPILGLSDIQSRGRNIAELNLMLPTIQNYNDIVLLDIKLKRDNHKSVESNLGLVYRHNFSDKAIFGIYGYFDRRKTQSNLIANQLTVGLELLSTLLDGRFNFYIPENKKKILTHENKTFKRDHTRVYVKLNGLTGEHPIGGYDIEIGTPLFRFLPKFDDRLGTKIYLANYKFSKKGVSENSGVRFRVEQKIKDDLFNKKQSEITIHLGSSYTNRKKWNNFAGLSFRVALSKEPSINRQSKMQQRMMDVVVRDVDIVAKQSKAADRTLPIYWEGKKIENVYFVGETNEEKYIGDGSYEKPYSRKQLTHDIDNGKFQKNDTDLIIPIMLSSPLSEAQYQYLISNCYAVDVRKYKNGIKFEAEKTSFYMDNIVEYFPQFEIKKIFVENGPIAVTSRNHDYKHLKDRFLDEASTQNKYKEKSVSNYEFSGNLNTEDNPIDKLKESRSKDELNHDKVRLVQNNEDGAEEPLEDNDKLFLKFADIEIIEEKKPPLPVLEKDGDTSSKLDRVVKEISLDTMALEPPKRREVTLAESTNDAKNFIAENAPDESILDPIIFTSPTSGKKTVHTILKRGKPEDEDNNSKKQSTELSKLDKVRSILLACNKKQTISTSVKKNINLEEFPKKLSKVDKARLAFKATATKKPVQTQAPQIHRKKNEDDIKVNITNMVKRIVDKKKKIQAQKLSRT